MFSDFFDGIRSYGKAYSVINKMRLWPYAIIPAIISVLLAFSIGFSAWNLSDEVGSFLISWYKWEWGSEIISNISTWLGGLLVGLLGFILFKYLVLILASPFMSFLSEKVEKNLRGNQQKTSFSFGDAVHDIVRGIRISFRNFFREIFLTLLILLLGLIPVLGLITPLLLFFVQAYFAGFGNMDYTLERHLSVSKSTQFVNRHRFLALGNGTIFVLLLMTGIGFLIAPPLATIAATIESVKRMKTEKIIVSDQLELI